MDRQADIKRMTNETDITVRFNADGGGNADIHTGIGFFDHMLSLFSKHGHFDLTVNASGDIPVDGHHTVEDIGIVMGQALKQALGNKASIKRYGTSFVPMDETLAMVAVDLSGRAFLVFDACFASERIGEMDAELVEEFFRSFAFNAGINLHIKVLYGSNSHHISEAIFKAFGRALDEAVQVDERTGGIMSTKGVL